MIEGEADAQDHPCLDYFLQNHVMEALCRRARRDLPRGCMPLVLHIVTVILRSIRYPLLPHQAVHKSLGQLISNASSLSQKYTAAAKNKTPATKTELTNYIRRIGMYVCLCVCMSMCMYV
jgi:hypothetical protein